MTSYRSGLLNIRIFSDEMAGFLGRSTGTVLELIHQGMTYVHRHQLYDNKTRTIYPDETIARFIGSQPILYVTFVCKMGQHIVQIE